MNAPEIARAFAGSTLMLAGKVVGPTLATSEGDIALAGLVTEVATLTIKGGAIEGPIEVQTAFVVVYSQLGQA